MKHDWVCDETRILTTYPPKYRWYCKRCGKVTTYKFCSEGPPIDEEECPGGDKTIFDGVHANEKREPTSDIDKFVVWRDTDCVYVSEDELEGKECVAGVFLKDGTYTQIDRVLDALSVNERRKVMAGTTDKVNHPSHYTTGRIECIEAIRESMTTVEYKGYLKGNVLKYLWRYQLKENPKEDLEKAAWYLDRLIGLE